MRRSLPALAASVLTSALFLGGCGNGTVIGSSPSTPAPPITPSVTNEFPLPTSASGPTQIARGTDGFLYITQNAVSKIAKVTTGGVVTEYAIPTAGAAPYGIISGPDGRLWFSEAF
ncbi:MAG: hypothetical protein JO165_03500, partial [Candidatus Eremiobacteraeota bacterium]|nr:hypothetical protein [Candidatus Eremiobacteraeota bacterium]